MVRADALVTGLLRSHVVVSCSVVVVLVSPVLRCGLSWCLPLWGAALVWCCLLARRVTRCSPVRPGRGRLALGASGFPLRFGWCSPIVVVRPEIRAGEGST